MLHRRNSIRANEAVLLSITDFRSSTFAMLQDLKVYLEDNITTTTFMEQSTSGFTSPNWVLQT